MSHLKAGVVLLWLLLTRRLSDWWLLARRLSDVELEAVEPTRSSAPSPLPNAGVEPDQGPGRTADPLDWAVGATVSPDPPRCGSESPYPPQKLKRQKWLLLSLIALIILTVIGSAGALFV